MRGLTLHQPFASAIACGLKRIEIRSWQTSYRGPLLIHGGRRWTRAEVADHRRLIAAAAAELGEDDPRVRDFAHLVPLGCAVAVADLWACTPTGQIAHDQPWILALSGLERACGDYSAGRFGWRLRDALRLREPLPCRGSQGLWAVPEALEWAVLSAAGVVDPTIPGRGSQDLWTFPQALAFVRYAGGDPEREGVPACPSS